MPGRTDGIPPAVRRGPSVKNNATTVPVTNTGKPAHAIALRRAGRPAVSDSPHALRLLPLCRTPAAAVSDPGSRQKILTVRDCLPVGARRV